MQPPQGKEGKTRVHNRATTQALPPLAQVASFQKENSKLVLGTRGKRRRKTAKEKNKAADGCEGHLPQFPHKTKRKEDTLVSMEGAIKKIPNSHVTTSAHSMKKHE